MYLWGFGVIKKECNKMSITSAAAKFTLIFRVSLNYGEGSILIFLVFFDTLEPTSNLVKDYYGFL